MFKGIKTIIKDDHKGYFVVVLSNENYWLITN